MVLLIMSHRKDMIPETLYELYKSLGLPLDLLNPADEFTIHNVRDLLHGELPYTSPRYRPNFFNFLFVKDARGRYTIDEMGFDLEPGTVYFTNPGVYRTFGWREIGEAYLITFNESFLKENVHADIYGEFPFLLTETIRPLRLEEGAFAEFELLYIQIYREQRGDSPYKKKIIGNLFVVLLLKIKERFWKDYNPIYEGNRGSEIVKSFKRELEKHFRELVHGKAERVLRASDYAALQNLHPSYFNNVIKSKTGKPVTVWIAGKTVSEAKSLLQQPAVSIKEIAYTLGFAESTHFSAFFKKQTGHSPADYRRQVVKA
ncbi:MAG TPA: helix-turn-helix domain-containing protein [Puia sp.]|jgi:AraC family transcriptional activator of pobA|nr:helix-turn-helix domain-containing protein [Puia sp.]